MTSNAIPVAGDIEPESSTWAVTGELSGDAVDAMAALLIELARTEDSSNEGPTRETSG